jgi:hypothetical protein
MVAGNRVSGTLAGVTRRQAQCDADFMVFMRIQTKTLYMRTTRRKSSISTLHK